MMEITAVPQTDKSAEKSARKQIDGLSKPIGSLGRLEEYAVKLAGIRGRVGGSLGKKAVLVFAADNGVHAAGITPVPKSVTAAQAAAIANGLAGVSVLARQAGAEVLVYNVGIEGDVADAGIIGKVIIRGTNDISKGPAMTRKECKDAMRVGADAVLAHEQYGAIGMGEMGICNTTTTAAVACALLGISPEEMTGRGAGITEEQFQKKIDAIKSALKVNKPDQDNVIDVLSKVGGLDIAAMAGAFYMCAQRRIPAVVDGFISACAALCAVRLSPGVQNYLFLSHKSDEQGFAHIENALQMQAPLDLHMRLGEGSGCPLMFYLLEAALRITDEMGTFADSKVDGEKLVDLRT